MPICFVDTKIEEVISSLSLHLHIRALRDTKLGSGYPGMLWYRWCSWSEVTSWSTVPRSVMSKPSQPMNLNFQLPTFGAHTTIAVMGSGFWLCITGLDFGLSIMATPYSCPASWYLKRLPLRMLKCGISVTKSPPSDDTGEAVDVTWMPRILGTSPLTRWIYCPLQVSKCCNTQFTMTPINDKVQQLPSGEVFARGLTLTLGRSKRLLIRDVARVHDCTNDSPVHLILRNYSHLQEHYT